jgi:DNA primase
LCEGEKDVVVAISRGFNAVTFGSATMYPKKEQIALLQSKCNQLFVCFDADPTGITGMQNLIDVYPEIIPIYLPENPNIKGFDITDYFQINLVQSFYSLMQTAVKSK